MKKNFRRTPTEIVNKLRMIKADEVVVGCAVTFRSDMLVAWRLKHLGITLTKEGLKIPEAVVPPITQGKFSRKNVEGLVIVLPPVNN